MRNVKPISLSLALCVLGLIAFMLAKDAAFGSYGATRWEYSTLDVGDLVIDESLTEAEIREAEKHGVEKARNLEDKLNRMGDDGWELAVYTSGTIVFKRPSR